jgi:hypothetical protein
LAAFAFTVCFFRRPIKKTEMVPAVKHEQVSDVELWPASQQLKRKSPARLESPINISSDEYRSEQFPDTPKVKGRPSSTIPKALESQRYLLSICSCTIHYG